MLSEENTAIFKKAQTLVTSLVEGEVMRVEIWELSIKRNHIKHLSKSHFILFEKFHGLTDVETIYRKRYLVT